MRFTETRLPGVLLVEDERASDERGYFATVFQAAEFVMRGLDSRVAQTGLSYNRSRGTLRGLHYQVEPHGQAKVVRCTRGSIYDVVVDLRPTSPTLHRWLGVELHGSTGRALYVPAGFAHGFLTLEDDSEVLYHLSAPRRPEAERGLRWDDPAIGVGWPFEPLVIGTRDRAFEFLSGGGSLNASEPR